MDRQACYAANELAADAEIRKRCIYKGHKWSDCPDRQAILDELAAAHRSCP